MMPPWWDGIAVAAALITLAGSFATGWHLAERKARRILRRRRHPAPSTIVPPPDCDVAREADWTVLDTEALLFGWCCQAGATAYPDPCPWHGPIDLRLIGPETDTEDNQQGGS